MARVIALILLCAVTGCSSKAADLLNPFASEPEVELGERSSRALFEGSNEGGSGAERARAALEQMSSYKRAQAPQPNYPAVNPAVVRLMWVPDHLNKAGDMVPAHYYYLRVFDDRWAVQDAFDLEQQLNSGSSSGGGATPWVVKESK